MQINSGLHTGDERAAAHKPPSGTNNRAPSPIRCRISMKKRQESI